MGVSLFVMFESDRPAPGEFTPNPDGRTVAATLHWLDRIAASKGLPPFSRFAPDDAIEAFLDDGAAPPELWFDPADGAAAAAVLAAALRAERRWAKGHREGWAEEVAGCLDRLRADLLAAAQAGTRFSLAYG